MSTETEARIEQLEAALAHQDQAIDDMNKVILTQSEEIERLTRRLNKLLGRMDELEEFMPAPEAKKPPHY